MQLARFAAALTVAVLAMLGSAAPALAHPLGLPALVGVSRPDATTVVLRWQAAPDDIGALFRIAGVEVPEGSAPTADQQRAAGASDVMTEHVAATLAPVGPCTLLEVDAMAVTTRALTVTWRCPDLTDATTAIGVRVAVLAEVDERYRSLVYGSGAPSDAVLATASQPQVDVVTDVGAPDPTQAPPGEDAADPGDTASVSPAGRTGLFAAVETRILAALDGELGSLAMLAALLLAVAGGALHGLAPGHGKAIAGAYLIGQRGRPRHAVALGAMVALMHTGSTVALGVLLIKAPRAPGTGTLEHGLGLAAGLVVLAIGAALVVRRSRPLLDRTRPHPHDHAHDDTHDDHGTHAHGPDSHTHVVADVDPFTLRGVLALGAAGGLLPSPTALVVVISALATDRLGVGLALVGAFSLGLAGTVTAAGLAVLWGRDAIARRGGTASASGWLARSLQLAPLAAAVLVLCVGLYLTARSAAALLL
jgi:nickel/cobalt exporter